MGAAPLPTGTFDDLYSEVAPAVFAWASLRIRGALRPRLDPEDVLQEVCFRAWRAFADFNPELGTFRSWVFGIANRVLQEALRSLAKNPAHPTQTAASSALRELPNNTSNISQRVVKDEILKTVVTRLEQLDEPDRKLFILRGLEGMPHSDVAALLSVSPEVAAKRWQRLRDKLAEDSMIKNLVAV